MRFITLLLILVLSGTAARASTLDERVHADRNCAAAVETVDTIAAAEKANRGTVGDIIDLANHGLASAAKCKVPDGVTYARGMLTSQLGVAQTLTDPQRAAKTLRGALSDLDRCGTRRDVFGKTLQLNCRNEAMHARAVLARLPRPTHPERK